MVLLYDRVQGSQQHLGKAMGLSTDCRSLF